MIRPLRARHRWMIAAVGLITTLLFVAALLDRNPRPIDAAHPELSRGER